MPTSIATIPEDLFMKNLVPKQLKDRGSRLFSVTTGWYVCILIPCYVKYLLTAEKNPKLNSRFLIWVLRVLRTLLIHPHFSCSTQLWNLNASDECETTQVFSVTYLCKPEVDVLQEKNQKASPLGIFKSLLKALELCSDDKKKKLWGGFSHRQTALLCTRPHKWSIFKRTFLGKEKRVRAHNGHWACLNQNRWNMKKLQAIDKKRIQNEVTNSVTSSALNYLCKKFTWRPTLTHCSPPGTERQKSPCSETNLWMVTLKSYSNNTAGQLQRELEYNCAIQRTMSHYRNKPDLLNRLE